MNYIRTALLVLIFLLGLTIAWTVKFSSDSDSDFSNHSRAQSGQGRHPETLDPLPGTSPGSEDIADDSCFECAADFDIPDQDLDEVAAVLSQSDDPEHLLIAMLYGPDRANEASVAVAMRALEKAPNDRLILWNLLNSCAQFPQAPDCSGTAIEDRAIAVDGGNGQLWARVSALRLKRGDTSGALDALKRANAAPRFSDYRMEHIELFERGLAAVGNPPYRERIIQAIGMEAAMVSLEVSTAAQCYRLGADSIEWRQQCLRYGERLEKEGQDMLPILTGQDLQLSMHSKSGDKDLQATIQARQTLSLDAFREPVSKDGEILLMNDDQVLATYVSNLAVYGESGANALLHEDVERLKDQAGYDPCNL